MGGMDIISTTSVPQPQRLTTMRLQSLCARFVRAREVD